MARVLIATDAWHPQVNGVVRSLDTTARTLRTWGHTVEVVEPTAFASVAVPFYPEIRLALPRPGRVYDRVRRFRPDHVHVATEGPLGLLVRAFCRRRGWRFTTSYHTRFPEYLKELARVPLGPTYRFLRRFHDAAAAMMVATPSLEKELVGRRFRAPIRRWSRGVDLGIFHPRPKAETYPRPVLLYVGRVSHEKNIEDFLRLDLPGTKLVVGDGPARAELERKYPAAKFLGYRKGEALGEVYAAADVFVFPSRTDTFGIVVIEALASGLPVAAYPATGPIDIITREALGTVDVNLGTAVRRALTTGDPAACAAEGAGYTWERCTRQFLENLVPVVQWGDLPRAPGSVMALIGIDLGTTFSAVAALDDRGRPVTVPNRDGDVLTPSAVYLGDNGTAVVGQPALDLALDHPDRVATLVKRRMGYADLGRPVAGRAFRPETLSAVILRKLAADAALQLGKVTGCVITVPAYFDDTRRKATMDAGRIAGLDVLDIVDEPSAAALAYSLQGADGPTPGTVLVYDLGGGTFDVTVVSLGKKRFRVLAVEGDVRLGGKDWDDKLVDWAADRFQRETGGADPRLDPLSLVALQSAAERAKRTLSKVEQTTLTVNHAGRQHRIPVSRADFESVTKDLLVRTRLTTQQVLRQAALTWDKIDRVLLVGGSTHMPAVGRMLAEVTGKDPDRSLAVSEVVARGAAAHAGIVHQREQGIRRGDTPVHELLADVIEISVNAHSLGVEVKQPDGTRRNNILIAKNTQLPAAVTREYYTIGEGQSRVRVRILQGESPQAAACIPVGECWIDGLPELPKGSAVEVRCGVAANGRIEVTARDRASGKSATATIHRPGGLTEAQLAAEAEWVRGLKIQ